MRTGIDKEYKPSGHHRETLVGNYNIMFCFYWLLLYTTRSNHEARDRKGGDWILLVSNLASRRFTRPPCHRLSAFLQNRRKFEQR